MLKRNRISILVIVLIMFCSLICAEPINLESAYKAAAGKILELGKSTDFTIGNSCELLNEDKVILAYVFNLQPRGYIIVSANTDIPPVIAYSFMNNSQAGDSRYNILYRILKADIQLRIENVNNLPRGIIESRNAAWEKYLNEGTIVVLDSFEQWPPEGTTTTGGWLETNWHQEAPYSGLCPIDPVTHARSYTGCPATAMAMILNYHETVNGVHFDDSDDYFHNYAGRTYWFDNDHDSHGFPSFPELNEYLDTLTSHYDHGSLITDTDKAAISFACGIAATQVYSSEGSGTFEVSQAYDAYMKFNCEDVELLDESDDDLYDRLSQNMLDSLPAHLAVVTPAWDMGHNVVVDGYNTDNYYHINFGWEGTYNGWYLLPDEIPYGMTVIEGVIVDILEDDTAIRDIPKPESFSLAVYPNPFNSSCRITVNVEQGAAAPCATVEVFDLRGNVLTLYSDGEPSSFVPLDRGDRGDASASAQGVYIWQPDESITSGIYLVRARTESGWTASKRVVYLR